MVSTELDRIVPDPPLTADVLRHLELQLEASRKLLGLVLDQGAAVRARDVNNIVRLAGELQVEIGRRQSLDDERAELLARAGARLGVAAGAVTLEAMTNLMDPRSAVVARERSAELKGILHETQREHTCNRALMRQELSFLDYLLRLAEHDGGSSSYDTRGAVSSMATRNSRRGPSMRVLDLRA
jgi:hypothetical protein